MSVSAGYACSHRPGKAAWALQTRLMGAGIGGPQLGLLGLYAVIDKPAVLVVATTVHGQYHPENPVVVMLGDARSLHGCS